MMRQTIYGVVAVFVVSVFFASIPERSGANNSNIWDGELSAEFIRDVPSEKIFDSPFCQYDAVGHKRLLDPLGSLTPAELFTFASTENLGEQCIIRNKHGKFTEKGSQLLYSKGSNVSFHSLTPRTGLGIFEYIPAPWGEHTISTFRSTPQHTSVVLGYHPNWSKNTELVRTGVEHFFKHTSEGGSLRYANNQSYQITNEAFAFSRNGKFIVVSRGPYIEKINLDTLELTPVGYAISPESTRLAISNDGKYVAYGKNTYLNVIDAQNCAVSYEYGNWQALNKTSYEGCVVCDNIAQQLFSQGLLSPSVSHNFYRPYFSPAENSLYLGVGKNASAGGLEWAEYKISANDYTSDARGYLAMGDSFVSGEGDLHGGTWYEPGTDEQGDKDIFAGRNLCHLSRRSYPYLLAVELGYLSSPGLTPEADGLFHSVACSGAKIHNIIGGSRNGLVERDAGEEVFKNAENQYRYFKNVDEGLQAYLPGHRAQLDYFEPEALEFSERKELKPEIISLSIGGNDADFGGFLASCTLPGTCAIAQPGSDEAGWLGMRIASQKERLVKAFQKVKQQAPDARIYVHGYPEFVNPEQDVSLELGLNGVSTSNACANNVRFDLQERQAIIEGVRYMNSVIESAAREAGVFYVDISRVFDGGRLCDRLEDEDARLFNGVTAGNDIDKFSLCSWRNGCLGSESYHPNQHGHQLYAHAIAEQTNWFTSSMPEPEEGATPLPSEFFGFEARDYVVNKNALDVGETVVIPEPKDFISYSSSTSKAIDISYGKLLPGSELRVVIRSTPTELGAFTTDEVGEFNQLVELPDSIQPGSHTVYIEGVDENGETFIAYEPVYIAFSEDDFDGDGILNETDSCQTLPNVGIDADEDGIDDVCDENIEVLESEIIFEGVDGNEQGVETEGVIDDGSVPKGEISQETVAGNEQLVVGGNGVLGASTDSADTNSPELAQTGRQTINFLLVGLTITILVFVVSRKVREHNRCCWL